MPRPAMVLGPLVFHMLLARTNASPHHSTLGDLERSLADLSAAVDMERAEQNQDELERIQSEMRGKVRNFRAMIMTFDGEPVIIAGMADPETHAARVASFLFDAGFKVALSLKGETQEECQDNIDAFRDKGIPYNCGGPLYVKDFTTPRQETLDSVLKTVKQAAADKEPVVIHCGEGWGRTGTMLAALYIHSDEYNGMTENPEELLSMVHDAPEACVTEARAKRIGLVALGHYQEDPSGEWSETLSDSEADQATDYSGQQIFWYPTRTPKISGVLAKVREAEAQFHQDLKKTFDPGYTLDAAAGVESYVHPDSTVGMSVENKDQVEYLEDLIDEQEALQMLQDVIVPETPPQDPE